MKRFYVPLILCLFVVIGCRAAVTTPSPTSLPSTALPSAAPEVAWATYADWLDYSNPELGFAIQYPPHWQVYTLPERPDAVYFGPEGQEGAYLAGVRAVEGVTLEETVDYQVETLIYRIGGELVEQAEDHLNGYPGVRLDYHTGGPILTTWILAHKDRVYILGATPEPRDRPYDELLATFHFLD